MAQRNDWKFDYRIEEVRKAAAERARYHQQRETHWNEEQAKVEAELQEKGIEIRSHEITGGRRAEVVIDAPLAKRLDECQSKIASHQGQAEEYAGWERVLAVQRQNNRLFLDHQDVRFFGLDKKEE